MTPASSTAGTRSHGYGAAVRRGPVGAIGAVDAIGAIGAVGAAGELVDPDH